MRHLFLRLIALIFILVVKTICVFAQTKSETIKENQINFPKRSLALNWKAEPQFGGFYQADISGIWKRNKTNVEILEGGSGTPTIQMMAAGKVDYAVVSADELIIAFDRGARDLVAIFAVYQTSPVGIMTRASRNFQTLEQVFTSEGTLLWQSGLPYAQLLQKKYANKNVKTAPYSGGISAFQANALISQQCFVTSEPLLAKKAGIDVKTFLVAEAGFNPYTTVVVAKKSFIEANQEEVKTFVKAVRLAWEEYLKDPTLANQKMAQLNKSMNEATFLESAQAQKELIQTKETLKSGLGSMTDSRWQLLIDQLFELKIIKTKPKAKDLFLNLSFFHTPSLTWV